MAEISKIIIHCAATRNGVNLGRPGQFTAAQVIDGWHAQRGFKRKAAAVKAFNPHLNSIGYQYVIDCDGSVETGRAVGETGAHTKGHNSGSIGICLVGTDKFTEIQWRKLSALVNDLAFVYDAPVYGHRDFAAKICPGFDVAAWNKIMRVLPPEEHIFRGVK